MAIDRGYSSHALGSSTARIFFIVVIIIGLITIGIVIYHAQKVIYDINIVSEESQALVETELP